MQVIDVDGSRGSAAAGPAHPDFGMEHAAPLGEGDRDIDVPRGPDRKAGKDRIPVVAAAPDFDIGEIDPMRKIQQGPQEIHLPVAQGPIRPFVDFLEQETVRMERGDGPVDAFRTIQTIDPADALVDVVRHHPEIQLSGHLRFRGPG